jgi:hypothetical protein
METDKGYLLWLNAVSLVAKRYNIHSDDLLDMLYNNNVEFDYRQLYDWHDCYFKYIRGKDTNNVW